MPLSPSKVNRAFRKMRRMHRHQRVEYLASLPDDLRAAVARKAAGG